MSLYHFHVTQIKRSKGYSAVAAAAYRAGEKLYCDYYGETFDYTRKKGVLFSEIILPEHVPEKYKDRQALWDTVEKTEKHPKAQLAYSFDIALQNELSMGENIALARRFIFENFTSRGMIADWAVHNPEPREEQKPNPHFHVLCPMRPMDENGKWGSKQKREYVLDEDGNRIKNDKGKYVFNAVPTTDWGEAKTLEMWRKNWAELVNEKMREKGVEQMAIDHRSYEEAGVDKIPQIHEGAAVKRIEDKGMKTDKGSRNRWIISINAALKELAKMIRELIEWIRDAKKALDEIRKDENLTVGMLVAEYLERRNEAAEGYAWGTRKAKATNLKVVSSLYSYVQEKNIVTMEDLEQAADDLNERLRVPMILINQKKEQISFTKKQIRDAKAVIKNKPVFEESQRIWFPMAKKKFQNEHEKELKQYHAALRSFGTTGFEPDRKFLKKCEESLKEEEATLEQLKAESGGRFEEYGILNRIREAVELGISERRKQGRPAELVKGSGNRSAGEGSRNGMTADAERESLRKKMQRYKEEAERIRPEQRQISERKRTGRTDRKL